MEYNIQKYNVFVDHTLPGLSDMGLFICVNKQTQFICSASWGLLDHHRLKFIYLIQ